MFVDWCRRPLSSQGRRVSEGAASEERSRADTIASSHIKKIGAGSTRLIERTIQFNDWCWSPISSEGRRVSKGAASAERSRTGTVASSYTGTPIRC